MDTQQFHLKWNNHSKNALSSFQHLLDTNSLVDVTLTCSNGKMMSAHRMVLAACSEYFYKLFKDLPERHPVIVFKDASEEILRDLLLFIYRGEVEVQDSYLNDFLKFANTLQIKGLTQTERMSPPKRAASPPNTPLHKSFKQNHLSGKGQYCNNPPPLLGAPYIPGELAKSYLANLSKFSPLMPLPNDHIPNDFLSQLSSPNLYHALQMKNLESPTILKTMPLLKKILGDNVDPYTLAKAMNFQAQMQLNDEDSDIQSDNPSPTNKTPSDVTEEPDPTSPINLDASDSGNRNLVCWIYLIEFIIIKCNTVSIFSISLFSAYTIIYFPLMQSLELIFKVMFRILIYCIDNSNHHVLSPYIS